jgi:hypothetical protein
MVRCKLKMSLQIRYRLVVVVCGLVSLCGVIAGCQQPAALKLQLPKAEEGLEVAVARNAAIVIPYGQDGIFCYSGLDVRSGKKYRQDELRQFLSRKRADTGFMVVIRPTVDCTYKNIVDMLDEMKISDIKKFALVDITVKEAEYVKQIE